MTVTYNETVANARLQVVIDALDVGAAALLVIGTSALSGATGVLATITLADPCGTKASRVLTFSSMPRSTTASATGTAAKAELRTSAGAVVVSGLTVGTTGTDVTVDTVAVTSGQSLNLTSATITHP